MTALTAEWAALAQLPTMVGSDPMLLDAEIRDVILDSARNDPRSLQTKIGPSGLGQPCDRRLAYDLMEIPAVRDSDPWKIIVGKAVHSHLEEVFRSANESLSQPRWLVEQRVTVGQVNGEDIAGSTDLFDLVTRTVIDWKISGVKNIKKYKVNGPGNSYEVQANLYAAGWEAKGITVDRVAIMFLPRDGGLPERYFWSAPYDPTIAQKALLRASGLKAATDLLGRAALPLMDTAESYCSFCPRYKANASDLTLACPGHAASVVLKQRLAAGAL